MVPTLGYYYVYIWFSKPFVFEPEMGSMSGCLARVDCVEFDGRVV